LYNLNLNTIIIVLRNYVLSWALWLRPVILATQEADIRRILAQSQSGQTVHEILSGKNPPQKKAGGVAQGVGPEFKPQLKKEKKLCAQCQGCSAVIRCLPRLCEVLGLNPSTTKRKNKTKNLYVYSSLIKNCTCPQATWYQREQGQVCLMVFSS
jgi:hypothetical protein